MRSAIVFLVVLLTASAAEADVREAKAGKVTIDLPNKWTVDTKDEMIRASSDNGEIAFVLFVVDKPDVKAALTMLEGELYSAVQGLRWIDKTKKMKINKLPSTLVQGVGVSARATALDVLVVVSGPTPAKKGIVMFAAVDHDKLAANNKTIMAAFNSLKPMK
jgi:hypothetical protein